MEGIQVFDTTLRDGEQAAGARLGPREKLEIARHLARAKVDVIEAGYPISSPDDYAAVELIAKEVEGPAICGLSRAVEADIEACGKALAAAAKGRIHTGIGVSDIHIAGKFGAAKYGDTMGQKKARILDMAVAAVRCARGWVDDVEFYAEDAGRAEEGYLFEVLQAVIEAGATVVNIPDTTGYTVPEQYGGLIGAIVREVPNSDRAVISVHCHDDLGLAVANTPAGVQQGARQIEATINGIGERAGNAALEEVVMALRTRREFYGADTGVDARQFFRLSRQVADAYGMGVPANKAVVGGNAFAHSSGIHVDGVLKERKTYEIMDPADVGMPQSRVVLTARTGRHGLKHRLEEIGFDLGADELEQVYQRFLRLADKKLEVFDEDLAALVHDEIHPVQEIYQLDYLQIHSGTGAIPTATVRVRRHEQVVEQAACGDGPVDAVYKALAAATGTGAHLAHYEIRSATAGEEALGEVSVRLEEQGAQVVGRGASTDIIEASAKAYLDGLNKLAARQG